MGYAALKYLHVACAALSITGFLVRGALMLSESPSLGRRFWKIAPHVVDTVLLASAIALAVMLQQYPFVHGWMTAKLLALVVYILLGMVALKWGPTQAVRAAAFALALLVFGYIVSVAWSHAPAGFLG